MGAAVSMRHDKAISIATACANANIALCKYWGKCGAGNVPATPSIGFTLDGLYSETTVSRADRDAVVLNGKPARGDARRRVLDYLALWRKHGLIDGAFRIESRNSFPTAAGLASSASGFAALAMALDAFTGQQTCMRSLSRMARLGSGSAARSIHGGLTALTATADPAAQLLAHANDVPWGMVIVVVEAQPKAIGSREGMELSRKTSPYYEQWLSTGAKDYRRMRAAIRRWDLVATGELMEANTLAMHACMLATRPALIYWSATTVSILHAVQRWRQDGLAAYATTDAGAHVALLCRREDMAAVATRAKALRRQGVGVIEVIPCLPGDDARIISSE